MTLVKLTSVAVLALALGACQSLFTPNYRAPLEVKRDAWEHVKPGCSESDCPLVNIDMIHFPALPKLDGIVEKRLLQLTEDNQHGTAPATLQAYEQQYLASADKRNSSYLQAKVREQHDGLVIIELSSYLDSGGAHGMPSGGMIFAIRARRSAGSMPGSSPASRRRRRSRKSSSRPASAMRMCSPCRRASRCWAASTSGSSAR